MYPSFIKIQKKTMAWMWPLILRNAFSFRTESKAAFTGSGLLCMGLQLLIKVSGLCRVGKVYQYWIEMIL